MQALKWWKSSTRMFFDENNSGSGGSDGSGSASSVTSSAPSGGDGGAGSSTPAPDGGAASPEPSSPDPGPTPTSSDIDWSALGALDGEDSIEIPAAPPAAVPPAPKKYGAAAEVPSAPTPQAQPAPQPQTPPAPVPSPTQPEPAAAAPPVQLSPSDPLGIATALEANRDAAIAHLAQSRFALSQEDIAELEDNAAAFVPKMMARVHHETQVSMMKFLAQAVPGMVKQFQTVTTANTEAEDQFFEANKQLGLNKANKEHRAAAFSLAKIYRQANPDMPMEQLITDVGLMVAAKLKLPMVQQGQGAPAIPGSPQPAPRPTGFRPAVNGGGGASPNPEPENEWGGLARDFD